MPERVIDVLKIVHIQKDHCQASVVPARVCNQLIQPSLQRVAIGQAGQGIAVRESFNGFGGAILFGHVGINRDKAAVGQWEPANIQNGTVGSGALEMMGLT